MFEYMKPRFLSKIKYRNFTKNMMKSYNENPGKFLFLFQ